MASLSAPPFSPAAQEYSNFLLYETRARYYLVSYTRDKSAWRVLKISRMEAHDFEASEDLAVYTERQAAALLRTIADGNAGVGGLSLAARGCGVCGAIRFLEGYYLILITRRRRVGTLAGHAVYAVDDTEVIELPHPAAKPPRRAEEQYDEKRYLKLLSGVDLRTDFFFSYGFPLTCSVQDAALGRGGSPWRSKFCWNAHLAAPLAACLGGDDALGRWCTPLVHGAFGSAPLALCGAAPASVTLLARRSARFAGTRYRKRGVSDAGDVANDVETEQIVDAGFWPAPVSRAPRGPGGALPYAPPPRPRVSSVLQVRGSIPLFWSQLTSALSPKPDIHLARYDPFYGATAAHFRGLARRYGRPVVALSLIKAAEKRPRELVLRRELGAAVDALNAAQPVGSRRRVPLCGWDFSRRAKRRQGAEVLADLGALCRGALALHGIFVSAPPPGRPARRSPAAAAAAHSAAASLGWEGPPARLPPAVAREAWRAAGAETILGLESDDECGDEEGSAAAAEWTVAGWSGDSSADPFSRGALQRGVLRSNCIDCLDRTSVAQFALGAAALGLQLLALGLADSEALPPASPALEALSGLYQQMGDALAQQYGGSGAHTPVLAQQHGRAGAAAAASSPAAGADPRALADPAAMATAGAAAAGSAGAAAARAAGYSRELLTSVRRFYSAAITDADKQDALNLFLGHFVPAPGKPALWELDNDVWLHTLAGGVRAGEQAPDGGEADDEAPPPPPDWAERPGAWAAWRTPPPPAPGLESLVNVGEGGDGAANGEPQPPQQTPQPARLYAPTAMGGYTRPVKAAPPPPDAAAMARQRAAVEETAASERAAAAAAATRTAYEAALARARPSAAAAAPRASASYDARHGERGLWASVFDGARAAKAAASHAGAAADDAAEAAAGAAAAGAGLGTRRAPRDSSTSLASSGGFGGFGASSFGRTAGDDTLAAAQAFLLATDDLAPPTPEWAAVLPAAPAAPRPAMAPRVLSPRGEGGGDAALPAAQTGMVPSESRMSLVSSATAGGAGSASAAPSAPPAAPPAPGAALRVWLAQRRAVAEAELRDALAPAAALGALGLGVLSPTAPAANRHGAARAQLAVLTAAPRFVDERGAAAQARTAGGAPAAAAAQRAERAAERRARRQQQAAAIASLGQPAPAAPVAAIAPRLVAAPVTPAPPPKGPVQPWAHDFGRTPPAPPLPPPESVYAAPLQSRLPPPRLPPASAALAAASPAPPAPVPLEARVLPRQRGTGFGLTDDDEFDRLPSAPAQQGRGRGW